MLNDELHGGVLLPDYGVAIPIIVPLDGANNLSDLTECPLKTSLE
jgi:hypothetical protein